MKKIYNTLMLAPVQLGWLFWLFLGVVLKSLFG